MAKNDESIPTTQLPEEIPQTIPELYFWMKARMETSSSDIWKELAAIREELRELRKEVLEVRQDLQGVEERLSEEIRQRYIDLRQRINKLQFNENVMDERYELTTREINQLKKSVRELENKVEPPLAA